MKTSENKQTATIMNEMIFGVRAVIEAIQAGKEIDGHLGVHVEDWRKVFYAASTEDTAESKRKAFNRNRKTLVEKGELDVQDDYYFRAGFAAELEEAELMDGGAGHAE